MPDRRFEIDLDRWFGEAPAFADSDVFALRVEARLDRGWSFRQFLIGGLGVVGGLILVAQIVGSGVAGRLNAVTAQSKDLVASRVADLTSLHILSAGLPLNGEVIWMSAGLAAVALGFALTRAIKEF